MSFDVSNVKSSTADSTVKANSSTATAKAEKEVSKKTGFDDTAAVYEKSSGGTKVRDNTAIVAQLKAEAEKRQSQLLDIVRKSIGDQAFTFAKANNLKSVFENMNVDEDTILQAQKDIAEDGYWGVTQTSDRILDFAKALSGGDSSKAEELLDAFKKGYKQATKAWGDELPDISKRTYDAVVEKFQKWMDGTEADQ